MAIDFRTYAAERLANKVKIGGQEALGDAHSLALTPMNGRVYMIHKTFNKDTGARGEDVTSTVSLSELAKTREDFQSVVDALDILIADVQTVMDSIVVSPPSGDGG